MALAENFLSLRELTQKLRVLSLEFTGVGLYMKFPEPWDGVYDGFGLANSAKSDQRIERTLAAQSKPGFCADGRLKMPLRNLRLSGRVREQSIARQRSLFRSRTACCWHRRSFCRGLCQQATLAFLLAIHFTTTRYFSELKFAPTILVSNARPRLRNVG
jgi:hypothetical protein